jgi:heme/copper-type cytochrome/quinol oxidase subunit 2
MTAYSRTNQSWFYHKNVTSTVSAILLIVFNVLFINSMKYQQRYPIHPIHPIHRSVTQVKKSMILFICFGGTVSQGSLLKSGNDPERTETAANQKRKTKRIMCIERIKSKLVIR